MITLQTVAKVPSNHHWIDAQYSQLRRAILLLLSMVYLSQVACTGAGEVEPPGCGSEGFTIIPTATRPRDPDLFSPPEPPTAGDGVVYCPTPIAQETPSGETPSGFVATDVVNLSLDSAGQEVQAVAVGDDMLAVGWADGDDVYVALARGGNHFQVRRVDGGSDVSLAFSPANRLHVAYEQDGQVLYRAADQGTHPADAAVIAVGAGQNPQVVVDELNWAHVLYERDGGIYQAKHLSGEQWLTRFVTGGGNFSVRAFYNEWKTDVFGIPAGAYWFGLFLTVPSEHEVRVLRYLSWFNLWQQMAVFPVVPGEELSGAVGLDYHITSDMDAEVWVYAAWVTRRPNMAPPLPLYGQPVYKAVNPLYPEQLANPHQIYEGLNAVRWRSEGRPFDAGLRQTVDIPDPAGMIQFEAYGLAEGVGDGSGQLSLRLGIDPAGGNSPHSPTAVWSESSMPATFTRFAVNAPAAGETATLFLHATFNSPGSAATVVWDAARAENATLRNGDFEGPFVTQSTLTVPEGWSAYYHDSGNSAVSGRDVYTIYSAWSRDGGASWSAATPVTANRDGSGATTGAIRPDVFPVVTTATEPSSVAFLYIFESGDPPAGTSFLRFGRPAMTVCELGSDDCSESPGAPLLPRNVVRPSERLLLAPDPFHQERALLVWDALQMDYASKDIYATMTVVR